MDIPGSHSQTIYGLCFVCDITYEVKSKSRTSSIGDKYFQTFSASQELDPVEVSGLESSGG